MKTRLVLWGTNSTDERVLIAMELRAAENKVNTWVFPEQSVTNAFDQDMHNKWRMGETIEFPEGGTKSDRELTISDNLLPDELKTDRTDLVHRAQTEWHFIVLSTKLFDTYREELEELNQSVKNLATYSGDAWGALKDFWDKVQVQVRERNLFHQHADEIKVTINELFGVLKSKRSDMESVFQQQSQDLFAKFNTALDDLDQRIQSNARFNAIFNDLKEIQLAFRDSKLTREHGNILWERLDTSFKAAKDKRFGDGASDVPASDRIERRYEGLMVAVSKMQQSIDRDKEDLEFQVKKVATTDGQLEAQIRQAKIKMIESRIQSKEEKLKEMTQTRADLESKMESVKERERKRKDREVADANRAAAKKAAEEKINSQIKESEAAASKTVAPAAAADEVATQAVAEATPQEAIEIVAEVTPQEAVEAVAEATPQEAVEAVAEVTPQEAVEVVAEVTPQEAVEIVAEVTPQEAVEVVAEVTPESVVSDDTMADAATLAAIVETA